MNKNIKPFVIYKDIETRREIALFDINHIDHFINNVHLKRVKANSEISGINWSFYKGHIIIVVDSGEYTEQQRVLKYKGKNVEDIRKEYRKIYDAYWKSIEEQGNINRLVNLCEEPNDLPF